MPWLPLLSYFFGGAFLANADPAFRQRHDGRPFQSPFAKPPGKGFLRRPSTCSGASSISSSAISWSAASAISICGPPATSLALRRWARS